MRRAWVLPVEGPLRPVDLDDGRSTLHVMQAAVGGFIEPLDDCPTPGVTMYVNEEGSFGGEPNRRAADVAIGHPKFDWTGVIYGDVIFVAWDAPTDKTGHLEDPPLKVGVVVREAG